jgi:transposase
MDTPHGRALERSSLAFPFAGDLLATPSGMDRSGPLAAGLGATIAEARPSAANSMGRDNRRWNICPGEKRGKLVGKTKKGKGTKIMVLADGSGLPVAATIASATPAEVTLIEPLLETRVINRRPQRIVYDRAADSDPLRKRLAKRGIELVCPHRKNRKKPATQDGRKLRRYRRRWKIERSISWLQNFRRLVTRYERFHWLFQGFVHAACLIITARRF